MDVKLEFVKRALGGESISKLCREYEVSRPTGYLWLKRFKTEGTIASLKDRSHRPRTLSGKTLQSLEERVCELRRSYGWGARKLAHILLGEGVQIKIATVNRILKRNDLLIKEDSPRPAQIRFERERPNELLQMDFKGPMGRGLAKCEPLTVIDDHSRYVLDVVPVASKRAEELREVLRKIFEKYGVPEAILMDHGVPWYSTSNHHGLTNFSVWLMNQDIKLAFSGICHPQTQGKVERFHRTLGHAVRHNGTPTNFSMWGPLLEKIVYEYNYIRPHESLGMHTPSEFYKPSSKKFEINPKKYDYGDGVNVCKLDSKGRIKYNGKRYFVCQALADQYVKIDELPNRLAVKYRRTFIREIDMVTGGSTPL